MGKFRQMSTELLPLIYVANWFPCSILGIFGRFSSNFVDILLKIIEGPILLIITFMYFV